MRLTSRLHSGIRYFGVMLFAIPLAVLAETAERHAFKIAIDDGSPDGQLFVNLDDTNGIDLGEMQVGESQSIVDQSGDTVLVTRTEAGFDLNIDGRSISIPDFTAAEQIFLHNADDDFADIDFADIQDFADVQVEFDEAIHIAHAAEAQGVVVVNGDFTDASDDITIVSEAGIDAATREAVRAALQAGGYDSDVTFIDTESAMSGSEDFDNAEVHVVRKRVHATN